jgi:hypothetical protein
MARRILLNGWKLYWYYSLNASGFADKMVYSALVYLTFIWRNKPSLDFILKILDVDDLLDFEWEGSFPKHRPMQNQEKKLDKSNQMRLLQFRIYYLKIYFQMRKTM